MAYFNVLFWKINDLLVTGAMKIYRKANKKQRLISVILFLGIAAFFAISFLAGIGKINLTDFVGNCGFRQRTGLPCPSCFMTTSCIYFAQGKILDSFYVQPAAGLLCLLLVISAIFSLLTAVFGIYFTFLDYIFNRANIKYIVLAAIIVMTAGWAVTFARLLAARGQ
jgi:hypothetical protein